MIRTLSTPILLLLAGALAPPTFGGSATVPAPAAHHAGTATEDTVHVAPPTGEMETDRANVQAAFDAVQPGGTVLFAAGTYLLGAGAHLTVPDVTVLGHPEGTVLRGCDPEAFAVEYSEVESVVFGCTGLYVEAERQTIRGLTFEYTWHGIVVGPFPASAEEIAALEEGGEPPAAYPAGGQLIEGNTFRATPNGLRVLGIGNERSVVRDNEFIDVFHAIGIYGAPLHFLDNRVTIAVPGGVPFSGHTGSAIIVSAGHTDCAGHVVAGNLIEGYPDPIYVLVRRGETCRGVEIRDNTIHAARVKVPEAWGGYSPTAVDSTMVGTPITLMNRTEPTPGVPEADTVGVLEDILVRGNQIVGAEGLGILIQGVSRSRIADNTIVEIQRRDPFPGITWDGFEPRWEPANGSGIWVSPGSDGNVIAGNTFEDVAAYAVFLEGDRNRVELRSGSDTVHDLGTHNESTTTATPGLTPAAGPEDEAAGSDTVHVAPPTGETETDRAGIGYTFPSCDLPMEGPHGTSELTSRYVTMRDGVRLAIDVVLPDPLPEGAAVPTVLIMTRYWRAEEGQGPDRRARVLTSHGYAIVVGDVRGTGASFGEWPHHRSEDETRDFVEIIDWIVEQPWSDGRVAGFGSSYTANTADWMAARGHPALEAVVSRFPDFDPYVDLYFPGGVPNAYMGREWGSAVKEMDLNVKRPYEEGARGVRPVDADSAGRLLAEAIGGRKDVPSVWEGLRQVTYRDDRPESWRGASVEDWGTQNRTDEIERWGGPIQSWASWRDAGTANGVLNRFMTLDNPQRAFIGAWSHGGNHDADPYRPDSATARPPFMTQVLEDLCFLRRRFSDGSDPELDRKLVYYTMGEGRWKTTTEWPPAGSELEPWYLSTGSRLARAVPATGADEYEVDFTATTGTTNRWATNNTGGDVRYGDRAEEDRKLLTYTSDPLPRDLEITGQPVATFHVASTHEDGAFFVYLEDVAPDGTVRYLTEGMLRALHRNVADEAPPYEMIGPHHTFEREDGEPLVPGQVTTLEFQLMPLSVLVPEGHRLRIAIAGADADTFRRIPESGTPTISIHYGGERPSRVSLPVMRR